jgi:UDP-N-acetylmuramoyl-L-alanyl-D-glutamate--2,6-diaminopimelate ligase
MNKILSDILNDVPIVAMQGSADTEISSVEFDSRKITAGALFVAVPGTQVDGHKFIQKAIEQGATAVIAETKPQSSDVVWVQVEDSSKVLSVVASAWYDHPSEELNLLGITGTNGKTTTVTLLYRLYKALGYKAGLLSTVRIYIDDETVDATHTTPDALTVNKYLRMMADKGCEYAFMEVSSHAIHQNRVFGLDFDLAIFSNITHDHLDYHKTFADYIKAKKQFFDELPLKANALVNLDDRNGRVMIQNCSAKIHTYALKKPADFKAKVIENSFEGLQLDVNGKQVWTRLVGDFNAYNLLAVYGSACIMGEKPEAVLTQLSALKAAEGRFEVLKDEQNRSAIVDYAHTPDALENVVKTINNVREEGQQLIVVIGTGGDRDKSKRPVMAKIAAEYGDKVILTSDNPRTEDPQQIIDDMKPGIPAEMSGRVLEIIDRKQAIHTACMLAGAGDIVLVAGKGHETYQEVHGVKHHFDDKEIIESIFKEQKN